MNANKDIQYIAPEIHAGGGTQSKLRDSNIELYRIVTMLLIISHHYVVNSGLTVADGAIYSNLSSPRSIFLLLFGAWGKTGINCFVLITGYFMCKSQITLRKYAKLLSVIYFYRIIFYFVFLLTGYTSFSLTGLIKLILPVTSVSTGFVSCYLIFFLFIPFLNILVHNMTRIQHRWLLILVIFVYVVMATIPKITVTINYVTWFIVLYFISSYVRLYPQRIFDSTKFWGCAALTSFLISTLSVIICTYLLPKVGFSPMPYYFVADSNKILAVTTALSGLLFFKNLKIGYSKLINSIAATIFGVLLIHANSDAMRQWLWKDTLNNVGMYSSPWLVIHAFGSVIGIFIICSLIDMLRIRFVESPFFDLWDKHISQCCEKRKTTTCSIQAYPKREGEPI